jgi:hypothetical protein
MLWVLCAALLLGMAGTLLRQWPFDDGLGGTLRLGLLCGILYLPVLPGLLIWKMKSSQPDRERFRLVVVLLLLCFVAWLGALFLTFRAILRAIGL